MRPPRDRQLRRSRQQTGTAIWSWLIYCAGVMLLAVVAFTATYAARMHDTASGANLQGADGVADQWWRLGLLGSPCAGGTSPADLISIAHRLGVDPKVTEHRGFLGGLISVEVEMPVDLAGGTITTAFYRSHDACEAARAPNHAIPLDYR